MLWAIISSIFMWPIIEAERIYYWSQGYYAADNYDDAHNLAKTIIDNKLSSDECLKMKDVEYNPLRGFDGPGLNDWMLKNTCLEEVAERLKDPMICTKMHGHYSAGSCLYDATGQFLYDLKPNSPDNFDCWYQEEGKMLDCHYNQAYGMPDRPDLKPEKFSITQCNKFSRKETRDECNSYTVTSLEDCSKQKIEYYKESCYMQFDKNCEKSAYPILREECKARKIIDATLLTDSIN